MNPRDRASMLWVLSAVTVAYAMANVIIFYTSDAFGPVWFTASIVVYGAVLVAAVYLAIVDTGEVRTVVSEATKEATPKAEVAPLPRATPASQVAVFRTPGSQVVVKTELLDEGRRVPEYYVLTGKESLPLSVVEERLARLSVPNTPRTVADEVEKKISNRPKTQKTLNPESVVEVIP